MKNFKEMENAAFQAWDSITRAVSVETLWEFGISRGEFVKDWMRNVYGING